MGRVRAVDCKVADVVTLYVPRDYGLTLQLAIMDSIIDHQDILELMLDYEPTDVQAKKSKKQSAEYKACEERIAKLQEIRTAIERLNL